MTALRDHKTGTLLQSASGFPVQVMTPYDDDPDKIQVRILSGLNAGKIQGIPASEESLEPLDSSGASRVVPQYKDLLPPEIEAARSEDEPPKPTKRKRKSRAKKGETAPVAGAVSAVSEDATNEALETDAADEALEADNEAQPAAAVASRGSKKNRRKGRGNELTGSAPTPRKRAAKVDWLSEITLNAKVVNGTVPLGQRTLVHGPNASGKTTLLNGATLLCVGYANDLGGRDRVKLPDRLFTLAAHGQDKLEILGETAGGSTGTFRLTIKEDGGLKKYRRCPVQNAALLYDEIEGVLRGEEDKVRTFLVKAIYPQLTVGHLVERLPDARREALGNLLTALARKKQATTPTAIMALDKAADREAKDANQRASALQALADDQRARAAEETVPIPPGAVAQLEGELQQWRTHRDKIQSQLTGLRATLSTVAAGIEHQNRLGVLNVQFAAAAVELDEARAALAQADQKLRASSGQLVESGNIVHSHLKRSAVGVPCLGCGVPNDPSRLATWSMSWDPYYTRHRAATAQATEDHKRAFAKVAALERQHNTLRGEISGLEQIVSRIPMQPTTTIEDYEHALEQTKAGITQREQQYTAYSANQRAETAVQGSADDAAQRANTETALAGDYVELASQIKQIRHELATDAIEGFAARVQEWLPEGERFGVDLEVGAVGFIRPNHVPGDDTGPGVLDTAWSGGETIRLLGALAAASIPVDCEWPLLVMPDRSQDPVYLRETMTALANWPGQILMTSTCKPHRGKVGGWTLIDSTDLPTGDDDDDDGDGDDDE